MNNNLRSGCVPDANGSRLPKKILIYGINYAPEVIGVGRFTGELGRHLVAQGIEVEVVTAIPHYPGWRPHVGHRNRYAVEKFLERGSHVVHCYLEAGCEEYGACWRR